MLNYIKSDMMVRLIQDSLKHANPQAWENQSLGDSGIDRAKMYIYI